MSGLIRRLLVVAMLCVSPLFAEGPEKPVDDLKPFAGLWSGSWGGGESNGAVFQPVLAEMVVEGNRVELAGFRNAQRFRGVIRIDRKAGKLTISDPAGEQSSQVLVYKFELKGNHLTLTDPDGVLVILKQETVDPNPLANVSVDLVSAEEITPSGDLRVTEHSSLKVVHSEVPYFQPESRILKTSHSAVLQVQETGVRKLTIQEARRVLDKSTPVAIAYRRDDTEPQSYHQLWKSMGSAAPDGEMAARTLSRMLRPGTLVFVLSARENVPVP